MITVNIIGLITVLLAILFIGMMIGYNIREKHLIEKISKQMEKELSDELDKKQQELLKREEELNIKEIELSSDDNKKIDFTKDLLDFIDNIITIELINFKRFDILLDSINNDRKPKIDADRAIKEISTNAFDAIKSEIYSSSYSLLTEEYLMKYIQKRTVISYLTYVNDNVAHKL